MISKPNFRRYTMCSLQVNDHFFCTLAIIGLIDIQVINKVAYIKRRNTRN
jgi:hypothetical protein